MIGIAATARFDVQHKTESHGEKNNTHCSTWVGTLDKFVSVKKVEGR